MMNRATAIWLVVALAAALGLFTLKYRVQGLETQLAQLNRQTLQEEETIHLLKAEWSYLNQPDRIEAFARRHLGMQPVDGKQLSSIDDLPWRPESAPNAAAPDGAEPSAPLAGPRAAAATHSLPRPPLPPPQPTALARKLTLVREVR